MDWTTFLNKSDAWKLFTVDMFPAVEIEDLVWSQDTSYVNLWKTHLAPLRIGDNWSPDFSLWKRRKQINLPLPTANLTDFPSCIKIVSDGEIGESARADGYDIRFTAADGVTLLPHEREDFASDVGEHILNGGFDSDTTNWNSGNSNLASINGGQSGKCLEITRTAGDYQYAMQVMTDLVIGVSYTVTFYVKSGSSGNETFQVCTFNSLWADFHYVAGISSDDWVQYSFNFTATDTSHIVLLVKGTATPGTMLYDSVSVDGNGASGNFWVKSDVATTGTHIYIYYGNPSASDGSTPNDVWDSNFKAVYHMKDDPDTSHIKDSTANANNGTKKGANEPIEADGKIGKGQSFDGVDDYIGCGSNSSLDCTNFTIELWLKASFPNMYQTVVSKGIEADVTHDNYLLFAYGPGSGRENDVVLFFGNGSNYQSLSLSLTSYVGTWVHIIFRVDGTNIGGWINGIWQVGDAQSVIPSATTNPLLIGGPSHPLTGMQDELRISSVARSAAWIAYEYANMNAADGGLTWGAEEVSKLLPEGVVTRVTQDGEEYLEAYSLTEANSTVKSFYYDFTNQILYLHTASTDNPGKQTTPPNYDYVILAYVGRYISNAQWEDAPVVFPRITEALLDGGMEQWSDTHTLTKWTPATVGASTVNRDSTSPYSGAFCVRLDIDGSNSLAYIYQDIRLVPGAPCKVVVWYKHSGSATSGLQLCDSTGTVWLQSDGSWGGNALISFANSTTWVKYELTFTAHASYTNYRIILVRNSAASASCYFDKASLVIEREENPYLPLVTSQGMPALHQGVSLFHEGAMSRDFGTLQFVNDGWWYNQVQNYLWHLKDIQIRYGAKGSTWDEMTNVFTGQMRYPQVNELQASIDVVDNKIYTYKSIPPTHFDVATYPWLEDGAEGKPIPIIYGEFSEVVPTCIDITTFKYKVASHELEAIPKVWKNGVELAISTDYTVDLSNGEFTLLASPGQAFITCSVKGRKCDMLDGTYSENVADILRDLLITYGGLDASYIDMESFLDLKNSRSQKHHLYIDTDTTILDEARLLSQSALFHFIPLLGGKLGAFHYSAGVDPSTLIVRDEDWKGFSIEMDTTTVFKILKINYGRIPSESHYSSLEVSTAPVEWRHNVEETLELTTSLRLAADAGELADYYVGVLQNPAKLVKGTLPSALFAYRPGQKIIINKTRVLGNGSIYSVLINEPYRVLDLSKQMQTGKVDVVAWEDLQSSGGGFCEVCYHCMVCVSKEDGTCSVCYTCQEGYGSPCGSCQDCYFCQLCDSGQCSTCMICETCELCVVCEESYGGICQSCQLCNTGQCTHCEHCVSCQRCNVCENVCTKAG